jgi:hypothetical protein
MSRANLALPCPLFVACSSVTNESEGKEGACKPACSPPLLAGVGPEPCLGGCRYANYSPRDGCYEERVLYRFVDIRDGREEAKQHRRDEVAVFVAIFENE